MATGIDFNSLLQSPTLVEAEKTFSAFAGADIVAYMGSNRLTTLQSITVSITREVMPIYTMGDPNPKAFTKGKRAIAGSLVFTQFDRHAILKMVKEYQAKKFIGDLDYFRLPNSNSMIAGENVDINLQSAVAAVAAAAGGGLGGTTQTNASAASTNLRFDDAAFAQAIGQEMSQTYALIATRRLRYSDQIPPFDVTVTMVNERGQSAYTAVHQVQLVNEGWGFTLDDLNNEIAFTFVARAVTPLDSIYNADGTIFNDFGNTIPR